MLFIKKKKDDIYIALFTQELEIAVCKGHTGLV